HRSGDRQWNGAYEQRPSMAAIFIEGRKDFEKIGSEFRDNFAHHHPEYGGMVGFPGMRMRFFHDPTHVLGLALFTLWDRYGSFMVGTDAVELIVKEFAEFVDLPAVRFRFQAQLLNFRMPVESIELPAGLRIRRLSEQEVSQIHGGPVFQIGFT